METVTITNNGTSIQFTGDYTEIANFLLGLQQALKASPAPAPVEKSTKFVEFFGATLENYLKGGKLFVAELNRCYKTDNDYRSMIRLYHDLVDAPTEGWAKRRKLLLTTSAIWRYTFKTKRGGLKYQIAADTTCDDCGQFASEMVDRMVAEKLWVR